MDLIHPRFAFSGFARPVRLVPDLRPRSPNTFASPFLLLKAVMAFSLRINPLTAWKKNGHPAAAIFNIKAIRTLP
jgi:hypothetical protein